MMYNEFHDILSKSMSDVDINYYKEDFWKLETELFTKDINKTIDFILNECNDIEFTWYDGLSGTLATHSILETVLNNNNQITFNVMDDMTNDYYKFHINADKVEVSITN